jgi:hypothetical protein
MLDGVDAGFDRQAGTVQPFRVGGDPEAHPVGLIHRGMELLGGHLGRFRVFPKDGPRSRRHDLDVVRAATELAADGLAHGPRPVGLLIHRREQAAPRRGGRDDPSAAEDARPLGQAQADGFAQDERFVIEGPHIPDGGEPGSQPGSAGIGQDEPAQLVGPRFLAMQRRRRAETGTSLRVADDMDVGIDESRHDGSAAHVERAARDHATRSEVDRVDDAVPDLDRDALPGRPAPPIHEACVPYRESVVSRHARMIPDSTPRFPVIRAADTRLGLVDLVPLLSRGPATRFCASPTRSHPTGT